MRWDVVRLSYVRLGRLAVAARRKGVGLVEVKGKNLRHHRRKARMYEVLVIFVCVHASPQYTSELNYYRCHLSFFFCMCHSVSSAKWSCTTATVTSICQVMQGHDSART